MIPKSKFDNIIQQKGKEIFDNNQIKSLYRLKHMYYGKVIGNEKSFYQVVIDSKKKSGTCECDCQNYCKHMYAVVLKLKNNNIIDLNEKISILSNEALKDLLNNCILTNPNIIGEIHKKLVEEDIKEIDKQNIYYKNIREIENEYNEIMYNEYSDYELDFVELDSLANKLLKKMQQNKDINNDINNNINIYNKIQFFNDEINNNYECSSFDELLKYLSL